MIELAHWQAALGALTGLTENDDRYRDWLFWADREVWRPVAAAQLYSCGLTARAALRLAGGAVPPPLGGPYEGRNDVISRLSSAARARGLRLAGAGLTPAVLRRGGHILCVGANGDASSATGGAPACEHIVCTYAPGSGPPFVYTVEGGQRDAEGVDSIGAFNRRFVHRGDKLWLLEMGRERGRRVDWAIDVLGWPSEESDLARK